MFFTADSRWKQTAEQLRNSFIEDLGLPPRGGRAVYRTQTDLGCRTQIAVARPASGRGCGHPALTS